jgi:MarR family transcriptional regulator for hemolysin
LAKPSNARAKKEAAAFGGASTKPSRNAGIDPKFLLTMQMVLAARRWRSLLDDRLRPLGHSAPRMEAMSTIAHSPQLSAQVDIAKRIGIEGPTLTRMLDLLEADGLVERLPDPSDRRANRIKLTPKGGEALAEINAVANDLRTHLLARFDADTIDKTNLFLAQLLDCFDNGIPRVS